MGFQMKDKEKTKWASELQESVKRLASYRQTVSWCALQLFMGGKLVSATGVNTLSLVHERSCYSKLILISSV